MTHFDNSNLLRVIYGCPVFCVGKFRTRRTFRICDIGVRKLNTAWVKNIRLTIDKIVNTAALFLISVCLGRNKLFRCTVAESNRTVAEKIC